jgi:hypothetical protein
MVRTSTPAVLGANAAAFRRGIAFAITVTAIVALGPRAMRAQTQTPAQPVSRPPAGTSSEPLAADHEPLATSGVRSLLLESRDRSGQGALRNFSSSSNWHFDLGSENACVGCAANGLQPPANANAPWTIKKDVTYVGPGGAQFTLGVVGSRNNRLPLFMTRTLGSNHDLTVPVSSSADLSSSTIQWQLSAAVRKTLKQMSGDRTIGVVGDVFTPLRSAAVGRNGTDAPVQPSKAGRLGVALGF